MEDLGKQLEVQIFSHLENISPDVPINVHGSMDEKFFQVEGMNVNLKEGILHISIDDNVSIDSEMYCHISKKTFISQKLYLLLSHLTIVILYYSQLMYVDGKFTAYKKLNKAASLDTIC